MQPTISRHYDAAHLNRILNHPSVYPYVAGSHEGPLDFTEALEDDNIVALLGEYGGQVYHRLQPGLFEAHSHCLPEGRGPWMQEATRRTLHWIFTRTEAVEVISRVPHGNVAAKALAKSVGLQPELTIPNGWELNGKTVPADLYSLTIQGWLKSSPDLPEIGRRCGERLGISNQDETHARYFGAACEMIAGGQTQKAVVFYNRIGSVMGWKPLSLNRPTEH